MSAAAADGESAVAIVNRAGASPLVLACEHAANRLPAEFGTLGLSPDELERHIAWDPGALPVARGIARRLDAMLVASTISRLVVDCNRPLDAPDLIAELSETTPIPGNAGLGQAARQRRIDLAWRPFHATLDELIDERIGQGRPTCMVTIHSFTPTWKGSVRPWHVGVIHDADERMSAPLIAGLRAEGGLVVGDNEPYSPADRVYFTLEQHARRRALPCVMIEIRNDLIGDAAAQDGWAERLARLLGPIVADSPASGDAAREVHHA